MKKPLEFTFAPKDSMPLPPHIALPDAADLLSSPAKLLRALNQGKKPANLQLAYKIANNIRKPEYTLKNYHDDLVAAFPELGYYMIADSTVSSGGTPELEYLRTMGAAFAVYWLMRIGIDGERGFCFGVDASWRPNVAPPGHAAPVRTHALARTPARTQTSFSLLTHTSLPCIHRTVWPLLLPRPATAPLSLLLQSAVGAAEQVNGRQRLLSRDQEEAESVREWAGSRSSEQRRPVRCCVIILRFVKGGPPALYPRQNVVVLLANPWEREAEYYFLLSGGWPPGTQSVLSDPLRRQ